MLPAFARSFLPSSTLNLDAQNSSEMQTNSHLRIRVLLQKLIGLQLVRNQQIPRVLSNPNVHYRLQNRQSLALILSQCNPGHYRSSYSLRSISLPPIHAYILQVISFLKFSTPIALYAFPLSSKPVTCHTNSSSAIGQSEAFEWKCKSYEFSLFQISSSASCSRALSSCVLP